MVAVRAVSIVINRCMINWLWSNVSGTTNPLCPSPWKVSSSASEDVSASSNHVLGPGELLAVENKSISVFPEAGVTVSALFLQSLESVPLVIDLLVVFLDAPIIIFNVIIVVMNSVVVVVDAIFEVIDLVVQIDKGLSDSFKGNHEFCFGLDSFFVFNLVPDWVPLVEVTDLIPEVTGWNISIGLRCIVLDFIATI